MSTKSIATKLYYSCSGCMKSQQMDQEMDLDYRDPKGHCCLVAIHTHSLGWDGLANIRHVSSNAVLKST